MIGYEGFRKVGKFTLDSGVEVVGELSLNGMKTSLDLYSDTAFELHDRIDISGVFYDYNHPRNVSLVESIARSWQPAENNPSKRDKMCISVKFFPHFVLFSSQEIYIRAVDQIIYKISFTIDDMYSLFYDTTTFGSIHTNARSHLERILNEEKYSEKYLSKIKLGTHPRIFYFTGNFEVFSIDTVFGKISFNNYTQERFSVNKETGIRNNLKIDINFKDRKTIKESLDIARNFVNFLEIIAGRPQNMSKITYLYIKEDDQKEYFFDVYLCTDICHEVDRRNVPHPSDLPIQAAWKPDEFSRVLKYWAEQHDERRDARFRFSTAFAHQNNYTVERLVGAANMFDILPELSCPQPATLLPDLEEARCNARKMFKNLPVSPERDSILNALGRIGKPSLKRKVRHRAKLITDIVGERFPEIELVIDQAIDLRNHYVHGTKTKIDYSKISGQLIFFTDTLEFVFAASELVEAGWDVAAWIESRPSYTHPFGRYLASYRERLEALKKLLAEKV